MNWKQLVSERTEWVNHNFPPDTPSHSVLGVIEETGELVHHYLKAEQGIRGTSLEHMAEMRDAIGDITIYLLGVLAHADYVPLREPITIGGLAGTTDILFRLSYAVGNLAIRPKSMNTIDTIPYLLNKLCQQWNWDYEQIVMNTWDSVKRRDWIKYPGTGLPDPEREPDEYMRVVGEDEHDEAADVSPA